MLFRSIVVLVDDDNVLAPDYLERTLEIARLHRNLGTWSGQIDLSLEDPSRPPPPELRHLLCERAFRSPIWSNDPNHLAATPWGAGMCIRREVVHAYGASVKANSRRLMLDLQGETLAYGGDTGIAYTGCSIWVGMGVFPRLRLTHLIPQGRTGLDYLLGSLEGHAYSEVLHAWILHGRVPQPRSDVREVLGMWARWICSSSLERRMMGARQRGFHRARREINRIG